MKLYHFSEPEFARGGENWWPRMNPRLLVLLDLLRFRLDTWIRISDHHRALGRRNWRNPQSDHAVDVRGTVDAADCFVGGVRTRADVEQVIDTATELSFTALGFYPHWQPKCGFHFGVRDTHRPGNPALWGAVQKPNAAGEFVQTYVSLYEALAAMEEST